jgi:hypothetical protein
MKTGAKQPQLNPLLLERIAFFVSKFLYPEALLRRTKLKKTLPKQSFGVQNQKSVSEAELRGTKSKKCFRSRASGYKIKKVFPKQSFGVQNQKKTVTSK